MLIVFKREDKSLYRKCLNCPYFIELRDDKKRYPKTVGVICGAEQTYMAKCFKYDWYRACGRYREPIKKPANNGKTLKSNELQVILKRLRRIKR